MATHTLSDSFITDLMSIACRRTRSNRIDDGDSERCSDLESAYNSGMTDGEIAMARYMLYQLGIDYTINNI